jgi:hypothetical protein
MSIQRKTRQILAAQGGAPPFPPAKDPELKRDIPGDHEFNPQSLKPLTRMLWATSVALGHALTAYRQFSRLKSVSFSPDGMIGGRGYVMRVRDLRSKLVDACEELSNIADTVYDEIRAPHWRPKLLDLTQEDDEITSLLSDAEGYMEDPEGEVEEDMEEAEEKKPSKSKRRGIFDDIPPKEDENSSQLPTTAPGEGQGPNPTRVDRPQLKQASMVWKADSSVSPSTLPGPRVQHIGPGEGEGPFGEFNDDPPTQDDWGQSGGVSDQYAYPSEWDNDLREATSGMPSDLNTRGEGWDFGIGYGEGNDAHGQGAGRYENPDSSGKGVFGPQSGLPNDPGGKIHDLEHSDTTVRVEQKTRDMGLPTFASSTMPPDVQEPVARSDYFIGPKGNDFDGTARYGEAGLPGDEESPYGYDRDVMNTGYTYERPDVPYVKWDSTTPQMRPDGNTQIFGPVQGPYVKQA